MSLNESAAPVRARRAGRPPAAETPAPTPAVTAVAAPASAPVAADGQADAPVAPRVRKPFGARKYKLDNSQRPGFSRHWFNDVGNRIRDAQEAGYNFVLDHAGNKMTHIVGKAEGGGGIVGYRMEIPSDWYEADQAAKVAVNEEKMNQIKHGIAGGAVPGEDGAYRPVNQAGTLGADIRIGTRK